MGRRIRVLLFLGLAAASWWSYARKADPPDPAVVTAPAPAEVRTPAPSAETQRSADAARAPERGAAETRGTGAERSGKGFRSAQLLDEHFAKHGQEFGAIDRDAYLRLATGLRDRPAGGDVLEIVRQDGVITRFDRSTGAFLAFRRDGTIRTLFKPRQGETYFRRQAQRPAGDR